MTEGDGRAYRSLMAAVLPPQRWQEPMDAQSWGEVFDDPSSADLPDGLGAEDLECFPAAAYMGWSGGRL